MHCLRSVLLLQPPEPPGPANFTFAYIFVQTFGPSTTDKRILNFKEKGYRLQITEAPSNPVRRSNIICNTFECMRRENVLIWEWGPTHQPDKK